MLNLVHNGHIGIGRLSTRISNRDKDIVSSQLRSARRVSSLLGFNAITHLLLRIAFGYDPHVRHVSGLCLHLPQETACFKLVNEQPRMHERTVLHGFFSLGWALINCQLFSGVLLGVNMLPEPRGSAHIVVVWLWQMNCT